jgi:hypothetical protein
MLKRINFILYSMFFLGLAGCGKSSTETSNTQSHFSSEQLACLKPLLIKQSEQASQFARLQLEAMKAGRSTIELTLSERRFDEQICLEEAKCVGTTELVVGTMFDSCLDSLEHQSELMGSGSQ